MNYWRVLINSLVIIVTCLAASYAQDTVTVEDTPHDLAIRRPQFSSGGREGELCIFCHTPHTETPLNALWEYTAEEQNNQRSNDWQQPSDTNGRPDGSSILCLSCHDGTIALGDVFTGTSGRSFEQSQGISRTVLSDGHPVSFHYDRTLADASGELISPERLSDRIRLDAAGKMQCTTCHDAHSDTLEHFLVRDNLYGSLCISCHNRSDWQYSSHRTSTARWNLGGRNPWPYSDTGTNVAEYGCGNCHTPHSAGNGRFLLNYTNEEDNCLACHNGNVTAKDIQAELNKFSSHPVTATRGLHDPGEPLLMESEDRHVECTDCHEPHSVAAESNGHLPGPLRNVGGIDINGSDKPTISWEFELCFRCHGDSYSKAPPPTPRVHDQGNVRLQFDNGNPSFHPVVGPGTNTDVPSLISPMTENDTITCGDCHASDASDNSRRFARGPHGSVYPSILVRRYQTQDNTPESPTAYALCYECHDRNSIMNNESFREHASHIDQYRTPCNVCHDPHGISYTQGNDSNNTHLINFDTSVVFANFNGDLNFEDRGHFSGACSLLCHNSEHVDFDY